MKLKIEYIVLTISLLVVVGLGAAILFHLVHYSSYEQVEATVTETYLVKNEPTESPMEYIVMEYFRDGNRFIYEKPIGLFEKSPSAGDKLTIKCSPDNPEKVENPNTLKGLIFVESFLVVWTGVWIFAIIKKTSERKQNI